MILLNMHEVVTHLSIMDKVGVHQCYIILLASIELHVDLKIHCLHFET